MTGLCSDIGRQLLLKKTTSFAAAFKDAVDIEYAVELKNLGDSINVLTCKPTITTESRLDSLETTLQRNQSQTASNATRRQPGYRYVTQPHQPGQRNHCRPLLQLWSSRPFTPKLPFKHLWASPTGGRQLASSSVTHQPCRQYNEYNGEYSTINIILKVTGSLGYSPVTFLLDSGAAVSVIRLSTLSKEYRNSILSAGLPAPIGAIGSPLDVVR